MNSNFEDGLKQYSYTIDGNNLVITAGKTGNVIIADELKNLIVEKLTAITYNTDSIEIPVKEVSPDAIDIDKIVRYTKKLLMLILQQTHTQFIHHQMVLTLTFLLMKQKQ